MEQTGSQWNSPWNRGGTLSLKALANKVLEMNNKGNNPGTGALKSVPHPEQLVPFPGTNPKSNHTLQYDALSYAFEERAAIMEYDGGLPRKEAERLARIDVELWRFSPHEIKVKPFGP